MKQNPHTTEVYRLRFQLLYSTWESLYGEPTVDKIQEFDRAKHNKRLFDKIMYSLEERKKERNE